MSWLTLRTPWSLLRINPMLIYAGMVHHKLARHLEEWVRAETSRQDVQKGKVSFKL